MTKTITLTAAALVASFALAQLGWAQAVPGGERRSLQSGGLTRSYLQVVPAACQSAKARCAVVFGFHGGGIPGVSGAQFNRQTGLGAAALERGFIAIMPDARATNWNDGRPELRETADDVGFVKAMIAALGTQGQAYDPKRVFATGMSNGGHMSFRLACEMPESFAAVAPVVASLGEALSAWCQPRKPISILNIVGTADPLTPYQGGKISLNNGPSRGLVLSSDASMAFWRKANRCAGKPAVRRFDTHPGDGTSVVVDRYAGCAGGKVLERYTVVGGGHLWPGEFPKGLVARISGRPTKEFTATEVILDFFGITKAGR